MNVSVYLLALVGIGSYGAIPASALANPPLGAQTSQASRGCPADMVRTSNVCIDRWEISTLDKKTGRELSPYYPPAAPLLRRVLDVWQVERLSYGSPMARALALPVIDDWEIAGGFEVKAVSRPAVVPQGYLSRDLAKRACESAGKRLCRLSEWKTACRGQAQRDFPYGEFYVVGACNVGRVLHAAHVLHGNSSLGHLDPRMNLVIENGVDPLLRPTGTTKNCASIWGNDAIYDMVGNLDEWVEDDDGGFVGGFYARTTTKGCDARVRSHAPTYYDYSTGARCCRAIQTESSH